MKKLRIAVVVGTRPEIIRLSRVLIKLDLHCDLKLIHTGQNYDYELNEIFFKDLGLRKPDYFLNAAGNSAVETIGNILIKVDQILDEVHPDAMLVLGDTNSCMSVLAAKRKKIPIFHMEAGNRCFDQRVPEETNRKVVDCVADINLTYSTIARDYLLTEGFPPDRVIKTGSPIYEVLHHHRNDIKKSSILKQLKLERHQYFVVSAHREENVDSPSNLLKLATVLNTIAEHYDAPVIVSTHPRTRHRILEQDVLFHSNVKLLKPLGFIDYNNLQLNSKAVLSDSGTITEESSILQFSALNLREAHERPEGFEEASVMMVGLEVDRVMQALKVLEDEGERDQSYMPVQDYQRINVSDKLVRIIHSYTDYVKRVVWKEY